MKIVILDGHTLNPGDLTWEPFKKFGEVIIYGHTRPQDFAAQANDAEVLVVNKFSLDADRMTVCPRLQLILVSATGYNNIDLQAALQKRIAVYNVRDYGTLSVAQHVFALLLASIHRTEQHDAWVKAGGWYQCPDFSYSLAPVIELYGKTLGIIGFGKIGQAVARLGLAFGMQVKVVTKSGQGGVETGVERVSLQDLWPQVDVLTLHVPLTEATAGMINKASLQKMKPSAIIINTGRGGLIKEDDLLWALDNHIIFQAALDVVSVEPPVKPNPLLHCSKVLVTPHMAWTAKEARQRLMASCVQNLENFLSGKRENRVV